ncbi:hypothetical protein ACFL1I_00400 [Candidatus Omnitrophota bacterium]
MLRKAIAFVICSIGIILPLRLRIIYSEILGWITQFMYLNYVLILKFIIKELKKSELAKGKNER